MKVSKLDARQILDSRGTPTVEVDLHLDDGTVGRAAVPSGASTGSHEALELRDGDMADYEGKSVHQAVSHVTTEIASAVVGKEFGTVEELDKVLIELDGTPNKSKLGANAILPVSMAYVRAMATTSDLSCFEYIAKSFGASPVMPRPMFNIMNGGAHANWSTDIQEYMVIPIRYPNFTEALRMGTEIFHCLESILKSKDLSTNVGNEGGFAPTLDSNEQAFQLVVQAIEKAGYRPGEDVGIGLDMASSEFFVANQVGEDDDQYELRRDNKKLTKDAWVAQIDEWLKKYPIISVEDPLSEDAWISWENFLINHAQQLEQVVGDDLLVTNVERIKKAIDSKACNALLVKLNQIGTVSEVFAAMKLSQSAGWKNIVSHRSGETEDVFISHLAVGTGCGQIKTGAPSRGERTAKYNELIRIEEILHRS